MFYLKKIIKAILSIYVISLISFFLISIIPGDPATSILGVDASYENIERFNEMFGLNKDIFTRYILWLKNALKGDFGLSFKYMVPVKSLVLEKLPMTISIALMSLLIVLVVSTILSFYLNKNKNKYIEKIFDVLLGIFISVPSFWLGMIFIFLFSIVLKLFGFGYDGSIRSLIMPCIVISIPKIGHITMNIKENLYYETRQDYIKYLYSNGMKMKYLNMYVLKNAFLPILPILGLILIDLITGIVIIEQIFSIPGIGRLILMAVYSRDIALLQALIVYTSFAVIIVNLLVDILYGILDKRIKEGNIK